MNPNSVNHLKIVFWICIFSFFLINSCQDEVEEGSPVDEIVTLSFPNYFPEFTYASTPLTRNKISLGKKLFYEGKLSRNNAISCGFCHIQEFAFTHHGHSISHGIDDRLGLRNAPPLQNLAFLNRFMWDGVIHELNDQPISPISAFEEMDSNFPDIIQKLSEDENYPNMFSEAYGDSEINADRILMALGQFMATMISDQSKFDQYKKGEISLSDSEENGRILFEQKCSACHAGALQTDESFRNTGLYFNEQLADAGLFRVTLNPEDSMKFRVPSLRNIAITSPYMHDGRFYSLEAVLDFYREGIEDNPRLDPLLRNGDQVGIPISDGEKQDLIQFLNTLTDQDFISNPAFSEF
ncbi:cytochrome-c peroxidase [Moheibacter sp. BDHS18]|uniref:Cytochrome-c peroxidase n=1 Tax=Moheibacter lacus TaxID=2745851 RepID=A0A838ZL62_9FLAO|nr:cytochrome-c peroxidase [Moheibacter lacus]